MVTHQAFDTGKITAIEIGCGVTLLFFAELGLAVQIDFEETGPSHGVERPQPAAPVCQAHDKKI